MVLFLIVEYDQNLLNQKWDVKVSWDKSWWCFSRQTHRLLWSISDAGQPQSRKGFGFFTGWVLIHYPLPLTSQHMLEPPLIKPNVGNQQESQWDGWGWGWGEEARDRRKWINQVIWRITSKNVPNSSEFHKSQILTIFTALTTEPQRVVCLFVFS